MRPPVARQPEAYGTPAQQAKYSEEQTRRPTHPSKSQHTSLPPPPNRSPGTSQPNGGEPPGDELLTTRQVAAMLKVSDNTVRELGEIGELRGFRVGKRRQWRFYKGSVLRYMTRRI